MTSMTADDRLTTARGLLEAVLASTCPDDVLLDVSDALNELNLPGQLPTYPTNPTPPGDPGRQLDRTLQELFLAIDGAPTPDAALHMARASRCVHSALSRLGTARLGAPR